MSIRILKVSVPAFEVAAGSSIVATVTLSEPAPAGGLTILIDNNLAGVTTPATVVFGAGASVQFVTVAVGNVDPDVDFIIAFRYKSQVYQVKLVTKNTTLGSISVHPANVLSGQSFTLTIALTSPAPKDGTLIDLTQTATGYPIVPALPNYVTMNAGQVIGSITCATRNVSRNMATTITASFKGQTASCYLEVTK